MRVYFVASVVAVLGGAIVIWRPILLFPQKITRATRAKRRLLRLRDRCLTAYPGLSSGKAWYQTNSGRSVCLRYLRNERSADDGEATLLILHGAYASTVALLPLVDVVRNTHRVFALDLPGWGVSDDLGLRDADAEGCTDAVIDAVRWFVDAVIRHDGRTKAKPIAVYAHSLGAYYAVGLARRHPELVSDLVLACPVGLFPTLGDCGAYWAFLFVTFAHHRLLRVLRWILFPFLDACKTGVETRFRVRLACSAFEGAHVLAKQIRFDPCNSLWKRPNLEAFSAVETRVSLIFGERDSLVPEHQAECLLRLTEGRLDCRSLREAPHCLHTKRFAPQIAQIIHDVTGRSAPSKIGMLAEGARRLKEIEAHAVGASLSKRVSSIRIVRVYETVLDAQLEFSVTGA
ncbi:hypothetical protein CYMTET_41421 [Cymbomonas tetramitiformis]|uniref:AB hydrolase-1 domain-containing protein n=1 Tax=Cymbomonas tetramitiformis TaxID=36881 RepID=A0AAE0F2A3_9CHLO|nr:hypothetical protein CYMTET_41421 [Cymbomonas tetramitiformis]